MKPREYFLLLIVLVLRAVFPALLLATLCVAASASGATYYVDPTSGSDSNAGTATNTPFAHIPGDQSATGSANFTPASGDTIVVKGGETYTVETNAIVNLGQHGVTYTGGQLLSTPWGSGKPIVDCSLTKPSTDGVNGVFSSVGKSNLTLRGFRFTGGNYDDSYNAFISARFTGGTAIGLLVDDCEFDSTEESAVFVWGSWDAGTASSGVVVTNCTFQDLGTHGVFLRYGLSGVLVTHCTFDNIGWRTNSPGPGGDPVAVFGHDSPSHHSGLRVRDCTFGGVPIKSWVILSDQTSDTVIEHNRFVGATGYAGFDVNGNATNLVIRNNLLDGRVTNYYGFVTVDTDQGTGTTVDGLAVHNNLLRGSAANNGLVFIGRGTSTSSTGVYDLDIRNNILISTNAGTVLYLEANSGGTATFVDLSTLVVDYNTVSGSATPFHVRGTNYSFASWQSTFGKDANSYSGAPTFAAGGGYMPAVADTAAKGAGVDLSGSFTDDLYGRSRVSWDIGPFAVSGDRYVTKSGSDSNTGLSESEAWLTVAKAASTLVAGETALIHAGTYAEAVTINGTDGTEALPKRFVGVGQPSVKSFTVYDPWVELNGIRVYEADGTSSGVYFQTGSSHSTLAACRIEVKGIGVRCAPEVDDLRIVGNRILRPNKGMQLYGATGGSGHLVASNEVWRPTQWIAGYDTDYVRLLSGPNHRLIHNLFHGATTNSVNTADGAAHVDILQIFAESGRPPCVNVLVAWNTMLDAMTCIQFTDTIPLGHGNWTVVSNIMGRGLPYHYTGQLKGQSPLNVTAAAGTMTIRRNTIFGMGDACVFLNCNDVDFEENVVSDCGTGYSFTGTTPGTGLRNVTWPTWSPDTGTGDTTNSPALRDESNPLGLDGTPFTWDDGVRPGVGSSAIGIASGGDDAGAIQFEESLLVVTEPTARSYLGSLLDEWAAQVRREGRWTRVEIREAERLSGFSGTAAARWAAIGVVSNLIEGTKPDAVQLVGALPWHIGGWHNMDGHYIRAMPTDAPYGCFPRVFTDTTSWGMNNSTSWATNEPGDGRFDEISSTNVVRAISRVDFSGLSDPYPQTNTYTWSSGCLSGTRWTPTVDEATALRNYFTTNLLYRRQGWSTPESGYVGGTLWTSGDFTSITNGVTTLAWTKVGALTNLGGVTTRIVYHNADTEENDDLFDVDCNQVRALVGIDYRSYGMWEDGKAPIARWLVTGKSLVTGWSRGSSFSDTPFWRLSNSDTHVADMVATSVAGNNTPGVWEWFYYLLGDLTLPLDTITQPPPRSATIGTATITTVTP